MSDIGHKQLKTSHGEIHYDIVPSDALDYFKENVVVACDDIPPTIKYYEKFKPNENDITEFHFYYVYFTGKNPSDDLIRVIKEYHDTK